MKFWRCVATKNATEQRSPGIDDDQVGNLMSWMLLYHVIPGKLPENSLQENSHWGLLWFIGFIKRHGLQ